MFLRISDGSRVLPTDNITWSIDGSGLPGTLVVTRPQDAIAAQLAGMGIHVVANPPVTPCALITLAPLAILQTFPDVPDSINGAVSVHAPLIGFTSGNFKLAPLTLAGPAQPSQFHTPGTPILSFDGTTVTSTAVWLAPTDWAPIRALRNQMLAASDWMNVPDTSTDQATRAAAITYRQTLRDIPQTNATPAFGAAALLALSPPALVKPASKINVQFFRVPIATISGAVSFVLPAGAFLTGILLGNQTANAITGGLKLGTTLGGNDVCTAIPVAANAFGHVPEALILKRIFSLITPQTIFVDAVTSWNGASLLATVTYGQL